MGTSQTICQKDIAKALGVSVNTVSHALRDCSDISIELKEKIKQKAKELGYVPNGTAIKLKTGSSKTIALVYDSLINPFFSIMALKLNRLLKQRGYDTIIFPCAKSNVLDFDEFIDILERQVDGILSFVDFDKSVIESKVFSSLPVIIVGRRPTFDIPSVNINGHAGGALIGKYFKNKKYNKVIYACPQGVELYTKRYEGLLSVYDENNVIKLYCHEEGSFDHIFEIIKLENIKAVFAFNDILAISLKNAFRKEKLNVEVVGFDYLHGELSYLEELSSVKFDFDTFADLSVSSLLNLINDEEINNKNIIIDVDLHIKE